MREATTGAPYWLYLPEGYQDRGALLGRGSGSAGGGTNSDGRRLHPLVMTFHGLKPFDTHSSQIREWQQEADRYGFVVCAPSLTVAAFSSPLPLTDPNNARLKHDEAAILAIMDELNRTVDVDPTAVLSTSWSYGGYVAHYMANRHPERFSCVAVRQSNFNANLLDPRNVPAYRDHRIAVFFTENDFAICRRESQEAAKWYVQQGFDLTYAVFEKKGHERTPGVAAEFFARTCGAEARTPPVELASMQVTILPVEGARIRQDGGGASDGSWSPGIDDLNPRTFDAEPAGRVEPSGRVGPAGKVGDHAAPRREASSMQMAPSGRAALRTRPARLPESGADAAYVTLPDEDGTSSDLRIRVSATVGVAPMSVWYSAVLPEGVEAVEAPVWNDNGATISKGMNGQRVFRSAGRHELTVEARCADGRIRRASRTITVLARHSGGE
jgi:pimeloyl-ACP methyl ester carboxylesterase